MAPNLTEAADRTTTAAPLDAEQFALMARQIARRDPILRVLAKYSVLPVWFGIGLTLLLRGASLVLAWHSKQFLATDASGGLLRDPTTFTLTMISVAILTYYAWIPNGVARAFQGLCDNRVVCPAPASGRVPTASLSLVDFLQRVSKAFAAGWQYLLSAIVASMATLLLLAPTYRSLGKSAWWTAEESITNVSLVHMWILIYAVGVILLNSLMCTVWLHRLFGSYDVRVRPLFPDHAGGLSSIGDFALRLSYLITLLGLMIVITPLVRTYLQIGSLAFRLTPDLTVASVVYLVCAPIAFFAPLAAAHSSMNVAKRELLLEIGQNYEIAYWEVRNYLREKGGDQLDLEPKLKELNQLERLYDTTSKFPVWPFDAGSMAKFATSYLAPIALAAVSLILEKLI